MTDDEKIEAAGEIDAAMGRVIWTVNRHVTDRDALLRELVESASRVLNDEPATLVGLGEAVTTAMLDRTPPPSGATH